MKKKLLILIFGLVWLFLAGELLAKGPANSQGISFNKPGQGETIQTKVNLNNWSFWVRNDGFSGHDPLTEQSGGTYPRGTAECVYQDGFIWGGVVKQSHYPQPEGSFRVGGQTYTIGTTAGHIKDAGTPTTPPEGSDPNMAYIYRIRRDWESLEVGSPDVIRDAADVLGKSQEDVTVADQEGLIADYQWSWEHWPGDLGAPYYDLNGNGEWDGSEVDEPGIADADQVVFFVYNDLEEGTTSSLYGSQPIGLEVQTTLWAYNQPDATLGQIIFKSSLLINKSGFRIDSMFVAQWCDPDVGVYTDDLVGCDPERSLGYAYSGFLTDGDYAAFGLPPAAMGYDFFQGPIVAGAPEDTAIFGLQYRPGFRNLPQYSFGYFAAGSAISDPSLGEYEGTLEWYNLLNGYWPTADTLNPTPFTHGFGPLQGEETKFPVDGDPVAGSGDLDAFGNNLAPGDRRMSLSSGPFTMEPGDSQEVVVAIVGGIVNQTGGNNRNAVAQLKLNDDFAQFVFNKLFQGIPRPPAAPDVKVTPLKDKITLEWGSNKTRVAETEAPDPILGFNFEGYNVYQYTSETRSNAQKIATFDLDNQILQINGTRFVPEYGDIITVPIQRGTDSGIQRHFTLEQDYINGLPLYAGNTYYFAVTAYNAYDGGDPVPEPALESGAQVIIIKPQSTAPGVTYNGTPGEVIDVDRSGATSDGIVQATVVDPGKTTAHEYEVFFTYNADSSDLLWNLRDLTANGEVKITDQIQAASVDATDISRPIVDGVEWIVTGPAQDFKNFLVVGNAAGAVDPPEQGAFGFAGFPLVDGSDRPGDRQQTNGSTWGINWNDPTSPDYEDFFDGVTQYTGGFGEPVMGISFLIPRDYEIRFTESGGRALFRWPYVDHTPTDEFMADIPFELWCVGDVDDPSDDFQCLPWINDADSNGVFNLLPEDHEVSSATNDPFTDSFYWLEPLSRDQAGYEALLAAHEADPTGASAEVLWAYLTNYDPWNCVAGMMRMVLVNWNGGDVTDPSFPANVDAEMPENGTVFRIVTAKPNKTTDVFRVTTPAITASTDQAKQDVEMVNVFPNPYYAYNPEEGSRFDRKVTFTHLPQKATIRIFSLGGTLVYKIDKDSESQFQDWNLRNESDLPVASGMYIVHIQMPEPINKEKILKLFVVQGAEILRTY